jgi:biopolymer transport protein ExbD
MSALTDNGRRTRRISLTPLIDVVFILLLFFMLSSSFQRWHSVDLPGLQSAATGEQSTEEPVFVLLHQSGKVNLWPENKQWASAAMLTREAVLTASTGQSTTEVLLVPEHQTSLQLMISAAEQLESLGFEVTLTDPVEAHDE